MGAASVWTTRYRPIRMEQIIPGCDDFDEDKYTKICMAMYGIENVRGGSYSQVVLTQAVKDLLEQEIRGASDVCFKCGRSGHFANECSATATSTSMSPSSGVICYKCGRAGHYAPECTTSASPRAPSPRASPRVTCFKCGRTGHYANQCISMAASPPLIYENVMILIILSVIAFLIIHKCVTDEGWDNSWSNLPRQYRQWRSTRRYQ